MYEQELESPRHFGCGSIRVRRMERLALTLMRNHWCGRVMRCRLLVFPMTRQIRPRWPGFHQRVIYQAHTLALADTREVMLVGRDAIRSCPLIRRQRMMLPIMWL